MNENDPQNLEIISSFEDLAGMFGVEFDSDDVADTFAELARGVYDGTNCGASMTLYFGENDSLHSSYAEELIYDDIRKIRGVSFGTIVEGSDAEFSTPIIRIPSQKATIDGWLEWLDLEAEAHWQEVNLDEPTD